MDAARWKQIKELFDAALEREPAGRAAFLAVACAGDDALRLEIESLIAADEAPAAVLQEPAVSDALKLVASSGLPPGNRRIGAYEIIREIGAGGMGVIYLAARADENYRQQVAIKLIHQGLGNRFVSERFVAERQILASLNHPNIARLLDGGATEDGCPYLVMEYIDGLPIDEYCDSERLSTIDRLKLFRTVSSAVQFAHQSLVIHRDIKPGNILVGPEGIPKLLDFGIAKILTPQTVGHSPEQTATALRLMTPDFASPEQVRGDPITTASDIYSLGVLLYKLLTGHHPYRFKTPLPQEIERVVCEQQPEAPSTAISTVEEIAGADGETGRLTP